MSITTLYDGEIDLVYEKRGRKKGYWIGKDNVVRVTDVLTPIPFTAAAMYGSKVAAEKFCELAIEKGVIATPEWAEIIRKAPLDTTVRDRGTEGHRWIEAFFDWQDHDQYPDGLEVQLKAFRDWFYEHVTEVHASEAKVYSKEYGYAGTCDVDWTTKDLGGEYREICDFKFGAIRSSVRTQTAAYMQARREEGHGPYDRRRAISLTEEGLKTEIFEDFDADFGAFLNLLEYHRWEKGVK